MEAHTSHYYGFLMYDRGLNPLRWTESNFHWAVWNICLGLECFGVNLENLSCPGGSAWGRCE